MGQKEGDKRAEQREDYLGRKLKCTHCRVCMPDGEPATHNGEFYHPPNGCRNAGRTFSYAPGGYRFSSKDTKKVTGIVPIQPKRVGRAKRRGAKAASKHRPR